MLGNAQTAYDLSQTMLSLPGGRMVKLADIATVKDAYSEQRTLAKLDGRQVISFNVTRAKGASDVSVYDEVWKQLHQIEKSDHRIKFSEINNSVDYTKNQYKSAMEGLLEGAVLAVLVVLLFLRDLRATAISALAIPMSAIPAFWFMNMLEINLNGLSLLAMSLVAGVLVDDAIVEIENIVRHMRMGKSAYQAALDAADEIGLAVLATTMSIVAVFLPVALMPGISGQFFKAFGFTVVVAVLMSLLVARMITPLIAAYFLRSKGVQPHAAGRAMDKYLGVLDWSLNTQKAHAYASKHSGKWGKIKSLRFDHRLVMVGAGFAALFLTVVLIATLPMTFQPSINQDTSTVQVSLPPGTTLQQTEAVIDKVADMVGKSGGRKRVRADQRRQRLGRAEAEEGPQGHQHPVRAFGGAQVCRNPRCARQFREPERRRAGRHIARPHAVPRRRGSGETAGGRQQDRAADGRASGAEGAARGGRHGDAGDRDQAKIRPRCRPRRDDGRAQPDDPNRDARGYRAEQREVFAVRPPNPNPGLARGERAGGHLHAREPAGSDIGWWVGAAEIRSRHHLRGGAGQYPADGRSSAGSQSERTSRRAS